MTTLSAEVELTDDEECDRYAEILAWLSGRLVDAVRAKDARAARVWMRRCLSWAPPPGWEAGSGETLVLLLAAQIPKGGDAQDRVDWLRDYGFILGSDGPLPVQEPLPLPGVHG